MTGTHEDSLRKLSMPYKRKITLVHVLLSLRDCLLRVRAQNDSEVLLQIDAVVQFLLDLAYHNNDRGAARILEQLQDSIRDIHMGVPSKSEIPSVDDIRALDPQATLRPAVTATIVRRTKVRAGRRPPELGYAPDRNGEYKTIDPDWLAVAHTQGPYAETFDLLCYMADGTLSSFYEFDTLNAAIRFAGQKCRVQPDEWEVCSMEITDPEGRPDWLIPH